MSFMTGSFPVTADGAAVGRVSISKNGLLLVFDCTCSHNSRDILRLAAVCRGKYVPLGVMAPEAGFLRLKKSYTKNALQSAGYEDTGLFHLIRPDDVCPEPGTAEPALPVMPAESIDMPAVLTAEEGALPEQTDQPVVYNDFPDPEAYDFDYCDDDSEPALDTQAAASELDTSGFGPESDAYSHAPEPEAHIPETAPADPQPAAEPAGTAQETADGWIPLPNPGILFEDESIQEACEGIKNALITERDGDILLAVPVLPTEPFPLMPVFCFGSSGQAGGRECLIFKVRNGNLIL